jgi:membrane-bound serine protease (ClpP class)
VTNDAVSYIRGLAELRGRNPDWAEEAVRQGASLTSSAALEKQVIDFLTPDVATLLEAMDGHRVEVLRQQRVLQTRGMRVEEIHPDWRTQLLGVITNPNVAFILMLVGVYGLIFELANPGAMVPGIAGAISLLLALFAFHLLPINYAGVALIGFGIILMGAEAFAPSFGALGIGGIVAFVLGSIILIEGDIPGFELYLSVIISFAVISAVILVFFLTLALRAFRLPRVSGREGLVGSIGTAMESFDFKGRIRVQGESWKAQSSRPVAKGQPVKVTAVDSLLLAVEPLNHESKPHVP